MVPVSSSCSAGRKLWGMTDKAMWSKRVSEWRTSGLSSRAFCEDKPFSAGGLRYWAHRLREEPEGVRLEPSVRMARVVRTPERMRPTRHARLPLVSGVASAPAAEPSLVIELGEARVGVRPGFDRATLAAVLDVLAVTGGGR